MPRGDTPGVRVRRGVAGDLAVGDGGGTRGDILQAASGAQPRAGTTAGVIGGDLAGLDGQGTHGIDRAARVGHRVVVQVRPLHGDRRIAVAVVDGAAIV